MNKKTFLKSVANMKSYDNKIHQLEKLLDVDLYQGFIGKMIDDYCDLLIISVNPNLEGLNKDYFCETFWQYLMEDTSNDDWAKYFDALVGGAAPSEYIKRYS